LIAASRSGVPATLLGIVAAVAASVPAVVRAEIADDRGGLRYDFVVDGVVTGVGFAFWAGTELAKRPLLPSVCRWCDANAFDSGARTSLAWDNANAAIIASNVGAFGLVPLAGLGMTAVAARHDGRLPEMLGNALIVAESVALAGDLSQIVKFAAVRERPFVHALPADQKPLTDSPTDNNVSFYSSHSSFAFALAVSSGTIASMRRYRLAPAVWAAGLVAAASVGYLRIAADKHYLTDVLVGAGMGSAFGWAVPYLFHRTGTALAVSPSPGGGGQLLIAARW